MRDLLTTTLMNKFKESPRRFFSNTLMSTGIIPFLLSMLAGTVVNVGFLDWNLRLIIAYGIPTALMIILMIFKLCNPLTLPVGHTLLLLFTLMFSLIINYDGAFHKALYDAFHYSMPVILPTLVIAICYYLFGFKKKTGITNIVATITAIIICVIWYSIDKRL